MKITIIGAGFAGIGLVIKLREAGFDDLLVLERGDDVGGTWRTNDYPGCACDVPSQLYSFSFAPNPRWSRVYSGRAEILDYARDVAARYDVTRDIRFGCEVRSARWDAEHSRWCLDTSAGPLTTDVLISATGPFGEPITPDISGLADFDGPTLHSVAWDNGLDMRGRSVGVIGTGASAVQIIPELAPVVDRLTVFQRTPCWIMPRFDWATTRPERSMMARLPLLRRAVRATQYAMYESYGTFNFIDNRFTMPFEAVARAHLRRQVRDPATRAKLTPSYRIGCKRAAVSSNYLPAFNRPNVDLATTGIDHVERDAVVTSDGVRHEIDTLVLATGFTLLHGLSEHVFGVDGRSLADVYRERPQSYLGVSVSGFPNLIVTSGPFAGAGNQSFLYMLEAQFAYAVDTVRTMRDRGIATIDVLPGAQDRFVAEAESRSAGTVWLNGGCAGYYTTADGARNSGLWPHWSFAYRRRTRRFDADQYHLSPTRLPVPALAEEST